MKSTFGVGVKISSLWKLALRKSKLIYDGIHQDEELPSKPRAPCAIDEEVDRGVDDEKEVGERQQDQRPKAKRVLTCLDAGGRLMEGGQFVNVKEDPDQACDTFYSNSTKKLDTLTLM